MAALAPFISCSGNPELNALPSHKLENRTYPQTSERVAPVTRHHLTRHPASPTDFRAILDTSGLGVAIEFSILTRFGNVRRAEFLMAASGDI